LCRLKLSRESSTKSSSLSRVGPKSDVEGDHKSLSYKGRLGGELGDVLMHLQHV
jgi:hypothetical protein